MRRAPQLGLKSPALATERHQLLMAAGIALDAQESVFEAPAFQVRLELFVDEAGQRGSFGFKPFEKPREVLFDESVERGLLRAVTLVHNWVAGEGERCTGDHWSSAVMGIVFTMRSDSGVVIWHSVPFGVRHCLAVRAHGARTADAAIETVNSRHDGCVRRLPFCCQAKRGQDAFLNALAADRPTVPSSASPRESGAAT